jgi:hypothetical protein
VNKKTRKENIRKKQEMRGSNQKNNTIEEIRKLRSSPLKKSLEWPTECKATTVPVLSPGLKRLCYLFPFSIK